MPSLRSFILHIHPSLLQALFDRLFVDTSPLAVNWKEPVELLMLSLQQATATLSAERALHVQQTMHRIERMTHLRGQQALSTLIGRCHTYERLTSSYERSGYAWLYEPHHFQAAETLLERRPDADLRWWGHYVVCSVVGKPVMNADRIRRFRAYLADQLVTDIDNLMVYPMVSILDDIAEQGMDIYHRANTQKHLCFSRRVIASANHDSVIHYQLMYCHRSGFIDVQAPAINTQQVIAHSFAHALLTVDTVAMRPMTLEPLRYQTIPGEDAAITRIGLERMVFEDIHTACLSCYEFPLETDDLKSIERYFDRSYQGFNPIHSEQFRLTEVTISIDLTRNGSSGWESVVILSLALPNQSTLRHHLPAHQSLGETALVHRGIWETKKR